MIANVMDMFSLKGKKAFVTGGARGIGKHSATAFAQAGADVAIVDLDIAEAKKTADEIHQLYNVKTMAYKADVTNPAEVDQMMEAIIGEFGEINIAHNNAGISTPDKAEDISYEQFRKVIDINLIGVFLTAQAAGKQMIRQGKGGSIVNTASMSGHIVNIPQTIANYNASKAGVIQLTKSLAVEWAPHQIRVNCVSPGYMLTDLVASMTSMHPTWTEKVPLGRLGNPEDLMAAFLYFASDASKYATGSDLVVDGGYICI